MIKVPTFEEQALKFKKMNRSTSSAYRLAHAVRPNEAEPFDPQRMLATIESTVEAHMADHVAAVRRLTGEAQTPETTDAPEK